MRLFFRFYGARRKAATVPPTDLPCINYGSQGSAAAAPVAAAPAEVWCTESAVLGSQEIIAAGKQGTLKQEPLTKPYHPKLLLSVGLFRPTRQVLLRHSRAQHPACTRATCGFCLGIDCLPRKRHVEGRNAATVPLTDLPCINYGSQGSAAAAPAAAAPAEVCVH